MINTRMCTCSVFRFFSDSLRLHILYPASLLYPWDVPGNNTGVGCHFLLQWILPSQGSNPCLTGTPGLGGRFFYH